MEIAVSFCHFNNTKLVSKSCVKNNQNREEITENGELR